MQIIVIRILVKIKKREVYICAEITRRMVRIPYFTVL